MESNDNMDVTNASAPPQGATDKEASQAVQVAVHIRPLIAMERVQGCKECISVVPGEPQIQLSTHSFTFDHVYGSSASPPSAIFEECVAPLVEGLFHGYNATVLAYGQTGSGKTYTMGTGYTVGGCADGVIPQVMDRIFSQIESLKQKADFQLRVSFIEILKEEVHDLLDPNPPATAKIEMSNVGGHFLGAKTVAPGKPPIQIRETTNGGITLAGVTEVSVNSLQEMASCLEQGSLCRATGSTNMNSSSSRSHAIFTINLEQRRKWDTSLMNDSAALLEDGGEDFLCAKLHLVDLAGSERAKRTGADGMRFKEGVHINKGLLALGNVISALGDDKKRKEGGHVPYRDSKLTRLLQDSLGGNSRTVMIACVSPADSNAEETLNTLKYANRARNIQNKPTVNRDPMAAEMQRMRQQLELMQAELLCARASGCFSEDIQILKQKVSWLEASNIGLRHELQQACDNSEKLSEQALSAQLDRDRLKLKLEQLRNGKTLSEVDEDGIEQGVDLLKVHLSKIQELEGEIHRLQASGQVLNVLQSHSVLSSLDACNSSEVPNLDYALLAGCDITDVSEDSGGAEMEAVAAKELEHNLLQDSLDKELQELNRRLELKEAEMKTFVRPDTAVLKQHFEKKLTELEEEKKALQRERDILLMELEALVSTSDEQTQKMQEAHRQKLKELEHQIAELRKKQDNQAQLLKQKQRSDEAAKRLQDDILRIKQHKVQLQNKIKQESEQFRSWKALREKEIVQLKKEGRRNEYEMHKLQALHQRQKMVLQRKTEEAAMATRRLKEVLDARKSAPRENVSQGGASAHGLNLSNEKALQQWLDHELEVAVRVHEVRMAYEKQCDSRSALANELANLKQDELRQKDSGATLTSDQDGTPASMGMRRSTPMSPPARHARIALLESMLNASSSALVAMASQLSEAEERERVVSGRARWQQLRSMGDAKNLLNVMFSNAVSARCQLRDKEVELKEIKERVIELDEALKHSESLRLEIEKQQRLKEKAVDVALATATKAGVDAAVKRGVEELSLGLSQLTGLGPRQLQNADDCSELTDLDTSSFPYALRQAARGLPSHKSTDTEDSDSSEWEIDMDLDDSDQSDKDWEEDDERFAMKGRGITRGGRKQERKMSSGSSNTQSDHGLMEERQGAGSKPRSFSDEGAFEENEPMSKLSFDGCCSCGQSSGCKTKKCECKAAGNFCGHKCGCKSTKCANRENSEMDTESSTRTFVTDVRTTDGIENARSSNLNKGDLDTNDLPTAGQHAGGNTNNLIEDIICEEQSMAKHGARLLESAWKGESEDAYLPSDRETGDEQHKIEDPHKPMQRRPLSDIGNRKGSSKYQTELKQKRRLPRALIQIVPSRQSTNIPLSDSAENAPEAVPPPTTNTVSTSNTSFTTAVGSSDVLADANLKADTSVPNIRLQNVERKRPAGSRQSQKGGNMEDNSINRRFVSGVNSPDKPARRIIDKENMR